MRNFAVMEVEEVRGSIVRFEHGQILGTEMVIVFFARKDREEKR